MKAEKMTEVIIFFFLFNITFEVENQNLIFLTDVEYGSFSSSTGTKITNFTSGFLTKTIS